MVLKELYFIYTFGTVSCLETVAIDKIISLPFTVSGKLVSSVQARISLLSVKELLFEIWLDVLVYLYCPPACSKSRLIKKMLPTVLKNTSSIARLQKHAVAYQ